MKKIFKMMFAVVAGVAALTACTNEPEEGVTPDNTQEYCIVKVGMSDATKGSLTDAEGIKWEVGDQIKYAGGAELTSEALTAEDIEDDGYTANFKFAASLNEVDRTGWFTTSTRNLTEFDFELNKADGNVYSQTEAGVMNSDYIFLHSGTSLINITAGVTPEVEMYVAGGIFRFMPYTETYNNEVVKSVELKSNNGKHLVGTVAYDRSLGTYKGANEVNWLHPKPLVKVSLDEPFALTNAKSRENSKGIYMAIARTTETNPIVGYTITVKTDVATYTFSSDENLVVGDNELRNVYLKLENGSRELLQPDVLTFVNGGIVNKQLTVSATASEDINLGYLVAVVNGTEMRNYGTYPKLVCVSVEDYNNGDFSNPVDWMSAHLQTNANGDITDCVWFLDVTENTQSEVREGVIVQDWSASGLYVGENLTPAVFVKQDIAGAAKKLTFNPGVGDKSITCDAQSWDHGYFVIFSNGTQLEANMVNIEEAQLLYDCIEIIPHDMSTGLGAGAPAAKWITLAYDKNDEGKFQRAWIEATAEKNTEATQRQVLVGIYMTPPAGYAFEDGTTERRMLRQFIITQEAYKASIAATLNDVYDGTVSYEGDEITVGTLALTADGEAVADANEFCNVAINGGASVVLAANGTITATIPANASIEAKEYTVTIKDKSGNTLVADVTINQEPNPEGGEVVEPEHTFSYTINVHRNGDKVPVGAGQIGHYFNFQNITIDGTTYTPGDGIKELYNNTSLMSALIAHAFEFAELTTDDLINATDNLTTNPSEFTSFYSWTDGGAAIYIGVEFATNTTGAGRTVKVVAKNADGSTAGYTIFRQD